MYENVWVCSHCGEVNTDDMEYCAGCYAEYEGDVDDWSHMEGWQDIMNEIGLDESYFNIY